MGRGQKTDILPDETVLYPDFGDGNLDLCVKIHRTLHVLKVILL